MKEWNNYKTPCYVVDLKIFEQNCHIMMEAFSAEWQSNVEFGYSVKTNHNEALMRFSAEELGWYIETVSPDEYEAALSIGRTPEQIILNGPCKQEKLLFAYENGGIINLDNLDEVEAVCRAASEKKPAEHTEIGLRINFDLESACPGETTAGDSISRFGICYENGDFGRAVSLLKEAGIKIAGIHLHTSTKSRSAGVFRALAAMAVKAAENCELDLKYVDMGGGFFGGQKMEGKPDMQEYAAGICSELKKAFDPAGTRLILEPGASVLATSTCYVSKVLHVRDVCGIKAVTLDGTLLHINPFMSSRIPPYELYLGHGEQTKVREQIVCGCTCMENDRFLDLRDHAKIRKGDIFVFKNAGAYTMAFNSDFIVRPPKVYIENR